MKVRAVLGAGRDDAREVRILNRYVRWNSHGERSWIEYEPDPRHAELIVELLNLESAKGVTTPSIKKRLEEVWVTSPRLDALQTRQYRGVVMRVAYLSQDRPDLSYSTKELTRGGQTSGRTTHDEPVGNDGLRVQRRAHIVGARSAVTNWRLKSSLCH